MKFKPMQDKILVLPEARIKSDVAKSFFALASARKRIITCIKSFEMSFEELAASA